VTLLIYSRLYQWLIHYSYPKGLAVILRKTNMVSFLKVYRSIRKIISGSPKKRTSWRLKSVQLRSTSEQTISTWTCGSGSSYWCWRPLSAFCYSSALV